MKPYRYERKAKGYCCIWDDGPYNKWKRRFQKFKRKSDRQHARKEIERERRDE